MDKEININPDKTDNENVIVELLGAINYQVKTIHEDNAHYMEQFVWALRVIIFVLFAIAAKLYWH